jgi:hypothetical protein
MAEFNQFDVFVRDLAMAKHNLSTHAFKTRLTNAAPSATMDKIACITTIATGNGYSTDIALAIATAALSGSTFELAFTDTTVEASTAGAIASWRYAVLYNSNDSTGHLIGWWDYGTAITLAAEEKVVLDFDSTNNTIKISST